VGSSRGVAICGVVRACSLQRREHCAGGGARRQNVAREAHGGFKSLLASRLRPLWSEATHPPNYHSIHRLWAQLSLVVTVVFPAVAGETMSLGSRCVPASGGRVLLPTSLARRCSAPRSSTWQTTAATAARGSAQLDDYYKVWAAYHRAQLKNETLWAAVVTDRPASSSDDKKSDPVVYAWDAMSEAAVATIQMSVKLVHLNTVTSVDTAKEAWDALKVMFEARDNAQLLRLMDELSSLKKGGDENIIKFTSRAKMFRDELVMLANQWTTTRLRCVSWQGSRQSTGCWRTRTLSSSCRT